MGVFARFTDIINANLNSILDKAENPEKMVNMIISEMEQTLVDVRSASSRAIYDRKELNRKNAALAREIQRWQERAEIALEKDREDLARAAIVEKNQLETMFDAQKHELVQVETALARLEEDVLALQEKLAEAKARREAIVVRSKVTQSTAKVRKKVDTVNVEKAFNKLEHFERRMNQLEAEVESYDIGKSRNLSDQIHALVADEAVEKELAALKEKVKNAA